MFKSSVDAFNQISIKSKLLILVFVSLGLAIFFGVIHTWTAYQDKQQMARISALTDLAKDVSELIDESQMERTLSAALIGSKGEKFAEALDQQRAILDEKLKHLKQDSQMVDPNFLGHGVKEHLDEAFAKLSQIQAVRQQVSELNMDLNTAVAYYTELNEALIHHIEYLTHVSENAEITEKIISYASYIELKEMVANESALLINTFTADQFSAGAYVNFVRLLGSQDGFIDMFAETAQPEELAMFQKVSEDSVFHEIEAIHDIVHQKAAIGGFGVAPELWIEKMAYKLELMKSVEHHLTDALMGRAHAILDEKNFSFMLSLVLLVLGLWIVISLSFLIIYSMNRSVTSMQKTMEEIAMTGNLALRVPVTGKDEFAQIGYCYNQFTERFKILIDSTNEVLDKIANGDFSGRMKMNVKGDLDRLEKGVNASAESVEFMMSQLEVVMDGLAEGDFSVRMDQKVPQAFRAKVDHSLEILSSAFNEVQVVMSAMQQGQYSERVNAELSGELDDMKQSVNGALASLDKGITEISQVMMAQSKGELSLRIEGLYQGRLEELKSAINNSSQQMSTAIANVKTTASTVRTASTEVAQGSDQISERSQAQAASLEQTAASIEQMTSTINQATELAENASNLSNEAIESARSGSKVMQETVVAMERINEVSISINDIVTLIDTIAFQTNLLALNAAVEAARAGEHGRGFAVVAGEVRNLAGRSAEAAKEIKELIEKTNTEVSAGTGLVRSSGEALDGINQQIEKVSIMVSEIAKGSREQAMGIDQINIAMASLDQTTQESAALVEQTASAAVHMAEDAETLQGVVNQFKISALLTKTNI